jgi:hypothetical protein
MMPERKPRPPRAAKADPEQSAEFIRVARELGCEENFHRLDQALKGARVKPEPVPPSGGQKKDDPG